MYHRQLFLFFFDHRFYFPAQLVGGLGFTLSDLLDKCPRIINNSPQSLHSLFEYTWNRYISYQSQIMIYLCIIRTWYNTSKYYELPGKYKALRFVGGFRHPLRSLKREN